MRELHVLFVDHEWNCLTTTSLIEACHYRGRYTFDVSINLCISCIDIHMYSTINDCPSLGLTNDYSSSSIVNIQSMIEFEKQTLVTNIWSSKLLCMKNKLLWHHIYLFTH